MNNSLSPTPASPSQPMWRLLLVDIIIAVVVLLIFGACGGFFLLVALNGFSEAQAMPILIIYGVVVIGGNLLVTVWVNRILIRRREKTAISALQPAVIPALIATLTIFVVGPGAWLLTLYWRNL